MGEPIYAAKNDKLTSNLLSTITSFQNNEINKDTFNNILLLTVFLNSTTTEPLSHFNDYFLPYSQLTITGEYTCEPNKDVANYEQSNDTNNDNNSQNKALNVVDYNETSTITNESDNYNEKLHFYENALFNCYELNQSNNTFIHTLNAYNHDVNENYSEIYYDKESSRLFSMYSIPKTTVSSLSLVNKLKEFQKSKVFSSYVTEIETPQYKATDNQNASNTNKSYLGIKDIEYTLSTVPSVNYLKYLHKHFIRIQLKSNEDESMSEQMKRTYFLKLFKSFVLTCGISHEKIYYNILRQIAFQREEITFNQFINAFQCVLNLNLELGILKYSFLLRLICINKQGNITLHINSKGIIDFFEMIKHSPTYEVEISDDILKHLLHRYKQAFEHEEKVNISKRLYNVNKLQLILGSFYLND
jgi:hypothetical protein